MTISAELVLDSISPQSIRLHTQIWQNPKFIHGEQLRHRTLYIHNPDDFSFSVSSSRAIPVSRNLEEVRSDELRAGPVYWGSEQKGMSGGEELDDEELKYHHLRGGPHFTTRQMAQNQWKESALQAANNAQFLSEMGVHKSIVNRILEPFLHVRVLVTGTTNGWLNFFGLRLDKNAQPEIRVLAEHAWRVWNESTPTKLNPGQWHLPFIQQEDHYPTGDAFKLAKTEKLQDILIRMSVARCARLSYLSFETQRRSIIEEDLKLYDRLVGSVPMHCYDNKTEVLTNKGFISWKDINENSKLANVDHMTGKFTGFENPKEIVHSIYNGSMYLYEGDDISLAITPEHNLYSSRIRSQYDRNELNLELVKANESTSTKARYNTVGETCMKMVSSSSGTICENEIEIANLTGPGLASLCGFFIGDGYVNIDSIGAGVLSFHLKKEKKIKYLEHLAIECGVEFVKGSEDFYKIKHPNIGRIFKQLFYTEDGYKTFPLEFMQAPQWFTSAFLEGLYNSDGSVKRKTWVYSTSSRELADRIIMIGALTGEPFTQSYISSKGNIILNASTKNFILVNDPRKSRVKLVLYNGLVHCASVSGKVLIIRRNGKIILSGNSSPAEHQATPDDWHEPHLYNPRSFHEGKWTNPNQHGNLLGWRQYRKFLPNESIAPLPPEYTPS